MKLVRLGAALLLAVALIVFGGNDFLHVFELPEAGDSAGERLLQSMRDGGLMTWIAASHVAVGVCLLVGRLRVFGALLQLPISLGILAFHATMLPEGLGPAVVMVVLNVLVLADRRVGAVVAPAPG